MLGMAVTMILAAFTVMLIFGFYDGVLEDMQERKERRAKRKAFMQTHQDFMKDYA